MVDRYRSVLAAPGCARVFGTALVGRLPQGMTSLAILLLVREHTQSYAAAGVAVGAYDFATAGGAPVLGRLVDRFGRRRVLPPVAVAQCLALCALLIAAHGGAGAAALIALSAIAGSLMPPIAPAVRALLRDLLPDPDVRETAYALESVIQEVIWIAGPLVVGAVIAVASPTVALLVSSSVCIAGTTLFVTSPGARGRGVRAMHGRRPQVLAIAELRAMLAPIFLNGLAIGAISVGLPALALHAGSRPATGVLLAVWSLGSVTGGLWYGARSWRAPLGRRYPILLLSGVACTAPLILARTDPRGHRRRAGGGADARAGVLLPVRARGPGGARRGGDRGVHLGVVGADRRPGRRGGARRRRGGVGGLQRSVRRRLRGDGARRGLRGAHGAGTSNASPPEWRPGRRRLTPGGRTGTTLEVQDVQRPRDAREGTSCRSGSSSRR